MKFYDFKKSAPWDLMEQDETELKTFRFHTQYRIISGSFGNDV